MIAQTKYKRPLFAGSDARDGNAVLSEYSLSSRLILDMRYVWNYMRTVHI